MRTTITPRMKIDCLLNRADIACSACGKILDPGDKIDWDHIWATVLGGPNTYDNLRPLHSECHKAKTKSDIQANAKVKRLKRGRKEPKRKMPSRPFPKRLTA